MAEKRDNVVSDFVDLNMRIYRGAVDMWAGWMKGMVRFTPLGLAFGDGDGAKEIVLEGEKGKPLKSTYTVRNSEFRTVTVRIHASTRLQSGDKKNGAAVKIEPNEIELGPWEKREVEISVTPSNDMEVGREYSADIETARVETTATIKVTRTK